MQVIAATTTETGLEAQCEIDLNAHPAGVAASGGEMAITNIQRHEFHADRNDAISLELPIRSDSS